MSLVRLSNVFKSFDSKLVLREVFFRLSKGDRVGLIGKNGVGKTTVLKLILEQEEPTEGTVEVDEDIKIGYSLIFRPLRRSCLRSRSLWKNPLKAINWCGFWIVRRNCLRRWSSGRDGPIRIG
jgi:ABC-type oligopeptide transport system ATPase subunit